MSFKIFRRIGEILTLSGAAKKEGRHPVEQDLSVRKNMVMISRGGLIHAIFPEKKLNQKYLEKLGVKKYREIDLKNKTVLPAFVESHTHCVFGGNRSEEFELRNRGMSYEEIARRGGGILSTVKKTNQANQKKLIELAQQRVNGFLAQGVGTLEVKSGYGLQKNKR